MKKWWILLIIFGFISATIIMNRQTINAWCRSFNLKMGDTMEVYNGVVVYYNGETGNVLGRNKTPDGYNLGLKYQCVEFVKRYYYEYYHYKMPNPSGNAIDFFNESYKDGELNKERGLVQFSNGSKWPPKPGDLLVMKGRHGNVYGHVAIVSNVNIEDSELQIVQQNGGKTADSRVTFDLKIKNGKYWIDDERILGWLRLKEKSSNEKKEISGS